MCFSAQASFTAAAILLPAGAASVYKAHRTDRRYLALSALPLLFGLQQLFEGMVWISGEAGNMAAVLHYSLAYMFFSWLAWPVWVPVACYFLEPDSRRPLYLVFIILGAMLGGAQYLPYFMHQGWLMVSFLPHAIAYGGTLLSDVFVSREFTLLIYVTAVIVPLIIATKKEVRIFGFLVALVLATTSAFFQFAYISVFCFGGALMSSYLVAMIFCRARHPAENAASEEAQP